MYHNIAEYLLEATEPTGGPTPKGKGAKPKRAPKIKRPNPNKPRDKFKWEDALNQQLKADHGLKSALEAILKSIYSNAFAHTLSEQKNDLLYLGIVLLQRIKKLKNNYKSLRMFIKDLNDNIDEITKDTQAHEQDTEEHDVVDYADGSTSEETEAPQVKEWTSYAKFRKEMFVVTVQMGWPDNLKPDPKAIPKEQSNKDANQLWDDAAQTPYLFANWGPDFLQKSSTNLKTYLMTAFKNDPEGLRKLSSKVNEIVEHEQTKFKQGSTFVNVLGSMAMFIFKGLGGQDRDLAFAGWLKSKFKKLTIFQYQQSILDDITLRTKITDETSSLLKKMLVSMRSKIVDVSKNEIETIKPIRTERTGYYGNLEAYFLVRSAKSDKRSIEGIYKLFFNFLFGFVDEHGAKSAVTKEPKGVLYDFTKKANQSPKFNAGPSSEFIKKFCMYYVTDMKQFRKLADKGLSYVWENKNSNGDVIGKYVWVIKTTVNGVRFSLMYDYKGAE